MDDIDKLAIEKIKGKATFFRGKYAQYGSLKSPLRLAELICFRLSNTPQYSSPHTPTVDARTICIAKMQAAGSRISTFCFSISLFIGQDDYCNYV